MKYLVLGGAGYIGSHMTACLLERGFDTVVADSAEMGHKEAVPGGVRLYEGNLLNTDFTDRLFSENKFDAVFDFAAYSLVGESVSLPLKYYENNVLGTLNVLRAMVKHGVKNIVFSSTAGVYGEPEKTPISEYDRTLPKHPYGESKLAVEKMLHWTSLAHGINFCALRYFNAAGAHPSGRIGEDHRPETHLIPNVLFAALGKKELLLYGDNYDTPDGTCVRDYVHVADLADAHLLALDFISKNNVNRIYNIGSGTGYSNMQIINAARKVTGAEIKYTLKERRLGDPATLVASSEKITRELGYSPKYNDIEGIIETAWKFHKSHPDGFAK